MSLERQEHNENNPWWGEHVHRYQVAESYLSGSGKVLDIACGNGFGTLLLSKKTTDLVIGADISEEAIRYCLEKFEGNKNLTFKIIDGTKMPFEENYFSFIVSFETIEHTTAYKKMLEEFKRTLMKDGLAIISTPNILINSPGGKIINPYHTQEFTYVELKNILTAIFEEVQIYGQKYIRYKQNSLANRIGQLVEKILYTRGVRKIPLRVQNAMMQFLIKKNMYPSPHDFELTKDEKEIVTCKTFFAICRKK